MKWNTHRKHALARLNAHGSVYESELGSRGLVNALIVAGMADRCSGRKGAPSLIQITRAGRFTATALADALPPCPCYRCAKQRLADEKRVNADTTIASTETRDDES